MSFKSTQRLQGPVLYLGAHSKPAEFFSVETLGMIDTISFVMVVLHTLLFIWIFVQSKEFSSTFFLLLGRILVKFCMRKGNY